MIQISSYSVTEIQTNSFLLTDEETGKMAIVDPGEISNAMLIDISHSKGNVEFILLTHGHFDHIGGAKELSDKFNAKIVIGEKEKDFLADKFLNLSYKMGRQEIEPFNAHILLEDEQKFNLGETQIKFINTPGHTIGSGCYIFDDVIISGDTLFCRTVGRTDLPTSSESDMANSIERLKNLEGDYKVYPGHGISTTLEYERQNNPYMNN